MVMLGESVDNDDNTMREWRHHRDGGERNEKPIVFGSCLAR